MHEYLDRRYALALYEVSEQRGKTEEYLRETEEIINIINANGEFLDIIKHPHLSTRKKKDLFESVFKGKIDNDVLSFLLILIEKNRILDLKGILEEMKKIHLNRNRTLIAEVKTVVPLTVEEKVALTAKLQNKYNKKIILKEELDKDIIGGVFLKIGNDIIDGTIKAKFEDMRRLTLRTE